MPDLKALREAAAEANGTPIKIIVGYRSYLTQADLFERRVDELGASEAGSRVARPGHSEHQLGTTIDITCEASTTSTSRGAPRPTGQWIASHAHEFGFILSYPSEASDRTCYDYEPWHLRYVGREQAAGGHPGSGVTLREYLWGLQQQAAGATVRARPPRAPPHDGAGTPPGRLLPTADAGHPRLGERHRGRCEPQRRRRQRRRQAGADRVAPPRPPCRKGEFFADREGVLADPKGFLKPYPNAEVEGLLTFRGQPVAQLLRRGPRAEPADDPPQVPDRPDVPPLGEPRHDQDLVRHGLDRPAPHRRAGGPPLGDLRRLRRPHPLHGRDHRRADPPRRRDRRHHQGHAHDGPRRAPARLLGLARQLPPGHRHRPARRGRGAVEARQRVGEAHALERRLGLVAARLRRLPDRGQREQPLLGDQAEQAPSAPTASCRSTRRSCSPRRPGTRRRSPPR